ncbi:Xaa-Pro aminopeptidase [Gemmobacter aquatilis]|uniref:Xaa-Pro aminopeptidase n=1 Tax=Gemmobacter aquatilis TaxID=933059 RepID=A0A1H8JM37_9RHOB|nr:Xaa-Pro aminopeptidase [Gemmobacter aquatilis]
MTPTEVFADLHRAAEALGGARLFTVSVQDTAAGLARRAYTSDAAAYPLSVPKPIQQDDWSRRVLIEGQPFIANTTAEFAPYFFDHAQINALGCFSAANLPVIVAGEVLGTINILDVEGHFTPARVAALQALIADRLDRIAAAMQAVPMGGSGVEARLARLRVRMVEAGVDLVALAPGAHMRWLCGFAPHADERACLALIGHRGAGFLMPVLNGDDARQHCDWPFWAWADDTGPDAALAQALAELGPVAALSLDETMRADHALLLLDALPGVARSFAADTVGALRLCKDASEISALRENARIADLAQTALRAAIRPGVTERELAEAARAAFRAEGAVPEFTIVGTGGNGAFPHHHTGETVVQPGDAIVCDIGARKDGYYSDITRMACCGTMPEGYAAVHAVVNAAVEAALATIRPGIRAREVDAAARKVITDAGYGPYFTHRTGHGVGQEIHEPPYITGVSDVILAPGMVFTVEPGIYLPGRFGIRLEEVAVVTETGCEILSTLPRTPFVA